MRNNARRRNGGGHDGVVSTSQIGTKTVECEPCPDPTWLDRLYPPVYAFTPVETRLFIALSSQAEWPKITAVTAPPGYGKTVLLSQLYRAFTQRGSRCIWIGLEEGNGSFGNLLALMETALGIRRRDHPSADTLRMTDAVDRVETVLQSIARYSNPLILFIDNINFCREPGVDRLLDALIFRTPAQIKLVISSAAGPVPFNAARARLELNLQTITASDLTFDRKATFELFSRAGITEIDPGTLEVLVQKTEGWPAAVRLLQLIAEDQRSLERGIEILSGDERHVADILSRRLMSSFEPELVTFLHEIAELRHLSVELAQAATGNEHASYWIGLLVDRNVMIVPIDRRRHWYRFHTLFRQFLVSEATRVLSATRRAEVHRNAAKFLMKRGDHQSALELAISAGELDLVTELLERISCSLVREHGDLPTFIEWVRRAEEIGARKGVQATFWYVWALLYERHYETARAELTLASEQSKILRGASFARDLRRKLGVAGIVIAVHLDAPDKVRHEAEKWLHDHPAAEPFEIAAAAGALACSRFSSHEYIAARRDLAISQAAIARAGSKYGRCWVELLAGMIEISQGNPCFAERYLREVELRARENIGPTASIASIVSLVRARALYDCGRFEEATNIVAQNLNRASGNGVPDTTWLGIEVALPSAVQGGGPFHIADLRAIVREYPKRLTFLYEMGLIHELILAGRSAEALEQANNLGWNAKSGWNCDLILDATQMERSAARLAAIVLFISSGHLSGAAQLIAEEMRSAQAKGRKLTQVDLHLLNAEVQLRSNARSAALRALSRAVAIAANHSLYAPFLRRSLLVRHLLENMRPKELGLTSRAELSALSEISQLIGLQRAHPNVQDPHDPLPDPPTPRELELLSLLESGMDNRQMAECLCISIPTIKWHLSNLYGKLGVKNRASAIARGRALRLLQQ